VNQACPISLERIDANFVRIIALQIITVSLLLMFTQELIYALILLFDFGVRILNYKKFSPFAYLAKLVINVLNIKPKLCDEAPKRFALYVGIFMVAIATLFYLLDFTLVASIIVIILIVCASLEALFDYCLGCKIYYLLQYFQIKR
jgi:hypothetical protein